MLLGDISFDKIFEAVTQKFAIRCKQFWYNNFLSEAEKMKFTSYRQKLTSFKRFSGIQWNFEIGFRCLVLLDKISFDKIFEAVT